MSTKAQRRANKQNAKHSTGPRTDQGKQICSQNALKHGLRSKYPVIPGEDPAEYQHKLDQLRADIRPVNALEDDLVEQIADTSWRLKRLSRIEAAIDRKRIDTAAGKESHRGKDDEQILGDGFNGWAKLDYFNPLGRYEAQLSRRYQRAIKDLRELRKTREENLFRQRPMEERDREEQQWRARHRQQPAAEPQPHSTAAAANGAPGNNIEQNEQTQSGATRLDSMSMDEIGELHPMEAVRLIEKEMQAMLPTSGHPGLQEVNK